MKNFFLPFFLFAFALAQPAAHADELNTVLSSFTVSQTSDTTFDFAFTGPTGSGSGAFSTVNQGGGDYLITGISGTADGQAITSLYAPGSWPVDFCCNDNELYYPPQTTFYNNLSGYVDIDGVSFTLADGYSANIYFGEFSDGDPQAYNYLTDAPVSTTPEPSSLLLLGTGVLAIAQTVRRRIV